VWVTDVLVLNKTNKSLGYTGALTIAQPKTPKPFNQTTTNLNNLSAHIYRLMCRDTFHPSLRPPSLLYLAGC
jgi:hypothetical protein